MSAQASERVSSGMNLERERLLENLLRYQERLSARLLRLESASGRLGTLRLAIVLGGVVVTYAGYEFACNKVGGALLVLFVAAFVVTGIHHGRVERSRDRHARWLALKRTHVARMTLDWQAMPPPVVEMPDYDHPFESDLNLTGERSLLQLLNTTITAGGHAKLLGWLRSPEQDRAEIGRRQRLVRSLTGASLFRDRLTLEAEIASRSIGSRGEKDLLQMVQHSDPGTGGALHITGTLAASNWLAVTLDLLNVVDNLWAVTIPVYAVVYIGQYRHLVGLFDRAEDLYYGMLRFGAVFGRIEQHHFADPEVRALCAPLQDPEDRPSKMLKRSARIAAGAGTQKSEILTLALNLLGPWDIFFAHLLEGVKDRLRTRLPAWLGAWHELEALNALATFAWLHPDATYPESDNAAPLLSVRGLGHPLIPHDNKVRNDFELGEEREICLITGSNMSGKSTFMRTVGVNLVLAGIGAPVDAASFRWRPARLFTCLQVSDSVNDGISYFYAEVRRLKALLEEARRDDAYPLIFLIDEIFRGTNNRERLIGSRAYIQALAQENAAGLIATHDLELVSLEHEVDGIRNYHFREDIEDGRMVFDYLLRPGPSPTTNALKIMKTAGLPIGS